MDVTVPPSTEVGLIGLGTMGRNLAENLRDHGFRVVGFDHSEKVRTAFVTNVGMHVCAELKELIAHLTPPRIILLSIPSGVGIDNSQCDVLPILSSGDVIADCGNSHFRDTERRQQRAASHGLHWVGVGLSGGPSGARRGPSIMMGGSDIGMARLDPLFSAIAARVNHIPCLIKAGSGGGGHFVKMVHNGIEYADMQLIAEAHFILSHMGRLSHKKIAALFSSWNQGELNAYLLEISAAILIAKDPETGQPMIDMLTDTVEQKGTGQWTVTSAMELGVPAPTIAEAVVARYLSAKNVERYQPTTHQEHPSWPENQVESYTESLGNALLAGRLCVYAQGFEILAAAAQEYGWPLNLAGIAHGWQGGCIIRAALLRDVEEVMAHVQMPSNPLLMSSLGQKTTDAIPGLRRIVTTAMAGSLPVPAMASALSYWDSHHVKRLWTGLIQAQRDFFGGHGYKRMDRPGKFYGNWGQTR